MEIEKIEEITKKRAKQLEIKKTDELEELERKLNFVAIKSKFWGRPNSI